MAQKKTPAKKRTTKKKTTSRKPSSKANNGKKPTRTSQTTRKQKPRELTRDDFINMDDIRKFKAGASELASGFKRGLKAQAAEHKAKKQAKKEKKQAKKDEKNAKYIEKYNKKLKLRKDENGVIETEPSPLDRSERTKKKRFKFW